MGSIKMFTTKQQLKLHYDKANFIKSGHFDEDQHSCLICLEPLTHPLKCRGCKKQVCSSCARRWLRNKKRCPQKCRETQWHLQPEKPTGILFRCPFDGRCDEQIYAENFEDHLRRCPYAPEEIRNVKSEEDLRKEYLCGMGHKLEFLGGDKMQTVLESACSGCFQLGVRSRCPQCPLVYCCRCRPPANISTRHCPLSHRFLIKDTILSKTFCDYCSKSITAIGGGYCYTDPDCGFDVCINCYELLPKEEMQEAYQLWENQRERERELRRQAARERARVRRREEGRARLGEDELDEEWREDAGV